LREQGLNDLAIEVFKKCVLERSKDPFGYKELAFTLYIMKRYEESLIYADVAIVLNKEDAYGYFSKGQCYASLSRFAEAIEMFKTAIKLKENTNKLEGVNTYYNQLGLSYTAIKCFAEAIECYQKAIEIKPSPIYLNNQADVYIKSNEWEKAYEILKKLNAENPEYSLAYSNLFEYYRFKKNYEEALKHINKAIELEPNNIIFLSNRGFFHLDDLNNKKEALNDLNLCYEISLKKKTLELFLRQRIN
jgi:tetratricopeptide (TPR) repeat protein